MRRRAERILKHIDEKYIQKVLDELFPFTVGLDGSILYNKANEAVAMIRDTFIQQCMGADNLANYRGTQYQVLNALTDYTQHYHKSVDKAYDLDHRMKVLPGVGVSDGVSMVVRFLRIADKISV